MLIGELAQRADITTRTIRYYEQMRLLAPNKSRGKHRSYTEEHLHRLQKIDSLKQLGLTLEEIAEVIDLYFEGDNGIKGKKKVLTIFENHLRETDNKITDLQNFRADLIAKIKYVKHFLEKAESNSPEGSSR